MKPRKQSPSPVTRFILIIIGLAICILVSSCMQERNSSPTVLASILPSQIARTSTPIALSGSPLMFTETNTVINDTMVVSTTPILVPTRAVLPSHTIIAKPTNTPTLTHTPLPITVQPVYQPQIVFTMITQDGRTIYSVRPDGSDLGRLESGQFNSYSPSWSPDGLKLAYLQGDPMETTKLTILDFERKEIKQIDIPGVNTFTWSPDGQRLAFTTRLDEQEDNYYVYLVDLPDLRLTPLYKMPGNKHIINLDWSPRGDKILAMFEAGRPISIFLRIFSLTGEYTTPYDIRVFLYDVSWDPSGEWFALSGISLSEKVGELWIVSSDITQTRRISQLNNVGSIDWSPDGKLIAFDNNWCCDPSEIFVINQVTGEIKQISKSEAYAYAPIWSPDGAFIAYLTATDDVDVKGYALNIYSFATGSTTQILNEKVYEAVTWRP